MDTRKYAIYSRKSKFTGKGESIENQIEICRRYLKDYYNATDEDIVVFEDEGFSGANTKRPQFQEMLKRCKNKEFKAVVCYRLDRISRNTADFVKTYEELKNNNTNFTSVSDHISDESPMGKAMMMISSVFAQLERDIIAERIVDNMLELAKNGRWLGGNTPTGYKSVETVGSYTENGKVRKARKLEQIPEEISIVKIIFDKFLELRSKTALETYLLNAGIKTKKGNPYSRFALKTILTNPVYMLNDEAGFDYFRQNNIPIYSENSDGRHGFIAYNKTRQESGKSMKYKTIEEWIISVGQHQGIVSGKDWVQVQSILEKNKDKAYRKPKNNYALLSGVLFCGNCGSYMRPKPSQRTDENGQRVFAYLCELKEKSKGQQCDMKRSNGNELDRAVIEEIKKLASDKSELIGHLKNSQSNITSSFKETEKEVTALEKNMKSLDDKIGRLVMSLANAESQTAQKYVYDEIDKLHAQKENLQRQIEEKKTLLGNGKVSAAEFERLAEMLSSFAESVDDLDITLKQDLIKALIKRIEWDGENVRIYFFGAEPQCEDFKRDTYAFPLF